jgi:hypothetical protein
MAPGLYQASGRAVVITYKYIYIYILFIYLKKLNEGGREGGEKCESGENKMRVRENF